MITYLANLQEETLNFGPWKPILYRFLANKSLKIIDEQIKDPESRIKFISSYIDSSCKILKSNSWQVIFILRYQPDYEDYKTSLSYHLKLIEECFIERIKSIHSAAHVFLLVLDASVIEEKPIGNTRITDIDEGKVKECFLFEKYGRSNLPYSPFSGDLLEKIKFLWPFKNQDEFLEQRINIGRKGLSLKFLMKFNKAKEETINLLKQKVDHFDFNSIQSCNGYCPIDRAEAYRIISQFEKRLDEMIESLDRNVDSFLNIDKVFSDLLSNEVGINSIANAKVILIRQETPEIHHPGTYYQKLHETVIAIYCLLLHDNSKHSLFRKGSRYFVKVEIKEKNALSRFYSTYLSGLRNILTELEKPVMDGHRSIDLFDAIPGGYNQDKPDQPLFLFEPGIFYNKDDHAELNNTFSSVVEEFSNLQDKIIPQNLSLIQTNYFNQSLPTKTEEIKGKTIDDCMKYLDNGIEGFRHEIEDLENRLNMIGGEIKSIIPVDNELSFKKELLAKYLDSRPHYQTVLIALALQALLYLIPLVIIKPLTDIFLISYLVGVCLTSFLTFSIFQLFYKASFSKHINNLKQLFSSLFDQINKNYDNQREYLKVLMQIHVTKANAEKLEVMKREILSRKNLITYHRKKTEELVFDVRQILDLHGETEPDEYEPEQLLTVNYSEPHFFSLVYHPQEYCGKEVCQTVEVPETKQDLQSFGIPYIKSITFQKDLLFSKNE